MGCRRHAGGGAAHAPVGDQASALGEIGGIRQCGDVDRNEVAIGHVLRAIGKGQASGFAEQMHSVRLRLQHALLHKRWHDRDIVERTDAQHLRDGDPA